MGGDGGSFSGRAEMVRTKGFKFLRNLGGMGYTPNTQIRAGDERLGKNENRDLQNSTCALSEEKLRPPIMACRVGRLYNKEKVISAMLEKTLPSHMKHIRSLKDMKECPIEDAESSRPESGSTESGRPKIKSTFSCPICSNTHSAADDLIPLSPDEAEASSLLEKAFAEQKAKKAAKKQKADKAEPEPSGDDRASAKQSGKLQLPLLGMLDNPISPSPPPPVESAETSGTGVVPKRLRDWVLESETDIAIVAPKHPKVTA